MGRPREPPLRFELLSIVMGVWDYIKNSGEYPAAANRAIESIGMIPGRRETFRIRGDYVMTQHDCQNTKKTPDSVGMGSYTLDSHNASRYVTADGYVQNEGDVQVSIRDSGPYMISYGSIIPKGKDCRNLYVVCAVSSSHIAYGSIRMEPVFMILGQSAATAAVQCIDTNRDVQDIDVKVLARTLRKDGQVLTKGDIAARANKKK